MVVLAQREYKVLTYRSLQPPMDFPDRGVSQLPNYFYREHSLMLWEAILGYQRSYSVLLYNHFVYHECDGICRCSVASKAI